MENEKKQLEAQLTSLNATMEKWSAILLAYKVWALSDGILDEAEQKQIAKIEGDIAAICARIAFIQQKKGFVVAPAVAGALPAGAGVEGIESREDNDCQKAFEELRAKCLSSPYSEVFGKFDAMDKSNASNKVKFSDDYDQIVIIYQGILPLYHHVDYYCLSNLSVENQWKVFFVRTQISVLAQKISNSISISEDKLGKYESIAVAFSKLPKLLRTVENIDTAILQLSKEDLLVVLSLIDDKSSDSGLLIAALRMKELMPVGFKQERERAVLNKLKIRLKELESYLTNDDFCSEQIIEKIVALSASQTEIDKLQGKLILLENNDDYKAAGVQAEELIVKLNTFAQGFDAAQIEEKELKSRCQEAYDALALFYREKDANIQRLQSKINSYPALETIIAYRAQESAYSKDAGRRIMAGCPSEADIEVLNALIQSLEALQRFFAADPNLQENSSFQGISIQEQLDKLKSMQKEALLYETQLADWKERLSEGNILEPKLFENGKGILENELPENMVVQEGNIVNTEELITNPIAVDEDDDNGNLTSPDDIDQGAVGDCYFLAAVSSIAATPNFFYNENNPNEGVIRVVYDSAVEGKVAHFLVRMYLPLTTPSVENPNPERTVVMVKVLPQFIKLNGRFPFAKPGDQGQLNQLLNDGKGEIWVAILEKAFAEVKGSYKATSGGIEEESFGLLLNSSIDQMQRVKLQSSKEIETLKNGENISDEVAILEAIRSALNEARKITVGSKEPTALRSMAETAFAAEPANEGDSSIRVEGNLRIVPGHSYSVQGLNGDLIRLRNPHGAGGAAGAIAELTVLQLIRYFESLLLV